MWLLSAPLVSALVSGLRRVWIGALWRRGAAWLLRWARGAACARRTHAFVFSRCTHGRADSVLATFDLYAESHNTLALGQRRGVELDEVVQRAAPRRVLELGLHCGYSAVRMLRLLPPAGRLLAVELDPHASELGEELILVAGFQHHQFQVLTCSSAEAIAGLRPRLHGNQDEQEEAGLDLVLMDHDPQQYLPDLRALEGGGSALLRGLRDPDGLPGSRPRGQAGGPGSRGGATPELLLHQDRPRRDDGGLLSGADGSLAACHQVMSSGDVIRRCHQAMSSGDVIRRRHQATSSGDVIR